MRVLITGGCGFIGSNLALSFRARNNEVVCFDNLSRRGSEILGRRVAAHGCTFIRGDIRNPQDLAAIPGTCDVMIECSAEPSVLAGTREGGARLMIDNNLLGSVNCFELARERRIPVLFLSTSRVYPHDTINDFAYREDATRFVPTSRGQGIDDHGIAETYPLDGIRSLYGATKLSSELILREYQAQFGLPALITRFGVVAGPWQLGKTDQGVFTYWMASHFYGKSLTYIGFGGTGKQVRDLLHIDDLIDLVHRQVEGMDRWRGDVYNAGGSTFASLSLAEATALCRRIAGRDVPVASSAETRPADVRWFVSDIRRATAAFGWKPTRGPEQILRDIHAWLVQHGEEFKSVLS